MSAQRSDWRERLHANPSRMEQELALKLQQNGVRYLTQVEMPVTTADFYFPLEPRPLLVFVDGRVHLGRAHLQGQKGTVALEEERIHGPRVTLQQLLGQETGRVIRGNPGQPEKRIVLNR